MPKYEVINFHGDRKESMVVDDDQQPFAYTSGQGRRQRAEMIADWLNSGQMIPFKQPRTYDLLRNLNVREGNLRDVEYKHCTDLVGKTIEAVGSSEPEGSHGPEPTTVLFFTDDTFHGFVHAAEDD